MATVKVKVTDETARVAKAAQRATLTALVPAARYIRGIAMRSIKVSPDSAPPGHQPHTRKGRLKSAIIYAIEREWGQAVIGPHIGAVGMIAHTHEFGGREPPKRRRRRGVQWRLEVGGVGPIAQDERGLVVIPLTTQAQVQRATEIVATLPAFRRYLVQTKPRNYPPRPFMAPALAVSKVRLPSFWANTLKGE